MNFYLRPTIFTEKSDNFENIITLTLPYTQVQEKIFTVIPKSAVTEESKNTSKKTSPDGKKYVALTFDDGPARHTNELLTTLKQKNVHATFFVLGQNVAAYTGALVWMKNDGHEIGNHSWDHTSFKKLSKQEMRNQIQKTDAAVRDAIGQETKIFRPPYGAFDTTTQKTVDKPFIMWSVDSLDWKNRNIDKNLKTAMAQVHD